MNIAKLILDRLLAQPEHLAICEPNGRTICCRDLHGAVTALAAHLVSRGLLADDRVVLQIPNGIELTAATLAVLWAGGVPVLCEPGIGDAVYASRIALTSPRWLLVHPLVAGINRTPGLRRALGHFELAIPPSPDITTSDVTCLEISRRRLEKLVSRHPSDPDAAPAVRARTDPAVVVFTGGTTRLPKGVLLSHGALRHYLGNIGELTASLQIERLVTDTLPQVLFALHFGRSAFITRGRRRRRAEHVLSLIQSGRVDAYFGAPYIWREMLSLAHAPADPLPSSLKSVLLGSAPVTRDFLGALGGWLSPSTRCVALYGLTEVGPVCAVSMEEKLAWDGEGDLVGEPLPNISLHIEGAHAQQEIGEVVVHGPSLYSGYLGAPPRRSGAGLFTGDMGRLVTVGDRTMLALVGRKKDMIIRRGINIYPGTLDPLLSNLGGQRSSGGSAKPMTQTCALIGLYNDDRQDEDVILCVEVPPGTQRPDVEKIKRLASQIAGADAAPDRILLLRKMPRTGRQNKIDKEALRAHARAAFEGDGWDWLPGIWIPFNWTAFASKYHLLIRRQRQPVAVLAQMALRLALYSAAQAGWMIDSLAARGWQHLPLQGPLFIIGHQRSGTTLLQRLLVQGQDQICALALHEMLLPAISLQRSLDRVARTDLRWGGHLSTHFHRLQDRLFSPLDSIHRIRFDEVEEDEFALWTIFSSAMCLNDAPITTELAELDRLRHFDQWPMDQKIRALGWYRACLQKKMYRESPRGSAPTKKWIVSKNPAFTHKVPELRRVFPRARFVYLVRNPLETIPSRLNLIQQIWRRRFKGFIQMSPRQVETILADSIRTYAAAERDLPTIPDESCLTIQYTDLVADPQEAAERIASHFNLPLSPSALSSAARHLVEVRHPSTSHRRHTLDEFDLEETRIRRQLAAVFDRYGF